MRLSTTVPELRTVLAGAPRPLGFFPTMGALHAGHLAAVRQAREECATVVASVFVNPLQFGDGEDFETYPRDLDRDAARLAEAGADLLFAPERATMFPDGFATTVDVGELGTVYEGAARPGHFAGVCTIVLKLFHAVGPDVAFFGRKDAQQVAVLRRMVRDLDVPVALRVVDVVRDGDGLALSSRNAYLSPEERARALALPRGLARAAEAWAAGARDPDAAVALARGESLDYDYLAVVDPDTFGPPAPGAPALLVAAARVGDTRLIDNVPLP